MKFNLTAEAQRRRDNAEESKSSFSFLIFSSPLRLCGESLFP
jgi:hypothetical protein